MAAINHAPGTSPSDRSRAVLELIHGWLSQPGAERSSLVDLVRDLAEAFAASAAGVAVLTDGAVLVREAVGAGPESQGALPWVEQPGLLAEVRRSVSALSVPSRQGRMFLCTAVQPRGACGWLFWVEAEAGRTWSPAESAALALAGQAAVRWLEAQDAGPAWAHQLEHAAQQRRLEDAAVWTRRLAHDYGNVLTSILGFTELSLSQLSDSSPLRRYLSEVHRGAQQGALLTERLRLFARRPASSGQATFLGHVLAQQRERFANEGPAVELRLDLPANLPPVALGSDALQDVLGPLLDNAREAIAQKGRVTVTAQFVQLSSVDCLALWGSPGPGPQVCVEISDTGCGLTADAEAKLFREPFFTNKPRHRGLGLATVYGVLVSNRSGFALLPGPQGGVIARVYLPIAAGALLPARPAGAGGAPAPARCPPAPAGRAGTEGKILVVDDDPGVLEMVSDTLRQVGYRVQTAASAAEAVALVGASRMQPFNLVLSDIVMEPTSGVELARQLLCRDANLRLLFMSGEVSQESLRGDLGGQPFELLAKPFRVDGLLRAVHKALQDPPRPDPLARVPLKT
ncbi:MAG: response regulator [Planctomycetes bacterium]|nr:response regulator [Planctomycetota bacterium]